MEFNRRRIKPPTDALRPIIPDNAWGTRITAAAGRNEILINLIGLYHHPRIISGARRVIMV